MPHILYGVPVDQIIHPDKTDKDKETYSHPPQFAAGDLPIVAKYKESVKEIHSGHSYKDRDFKNRRCLGSDLIL